MSMVDEQMSIAFEFENCKPKRIIVSVLLLSFIKISNVFLYYKKIPTACHCMYFNCTLYFKRVYICYFELFFYYSVTHSV